MVGVVFPGRRGKFSPRRGKKSGCLVRRCVREDVWMSSETFFLSFLDYGVFYKLRDKERSKESAYVLVAFRFLARPFVSFVSHIARYAPSSTDKSSSLRNQKSTQPNF